MIRQPVAGLLLLLISVPCLWCVDLTQCSKALRDGQYAKARDLCELAAFECAGAGDRKGESNAINLAGNALLRLGDLDGARRFYRKSIDLAKLAGDDEGVALRLNNLGGADYFQGRYEDAERHYAEAATWITSRRDTGWAAKASLTTAVNQATLLQRLGRDRAALDLYLKLRPQATNLNPEDEARMLANMGALYRTLGDPYRARELYADALQRFRQAKSVHGISGVLKNLAIAEAVEFHNYPAARRLFEQVLDMARSSGNQREQLVAQLYLAETAFHQGNLDEAQRLWQSSADSAAKGGEAEEEWRALYGLGRIAQARATNPAPFYAQSIQRIESLRRQTSQGASRLEFLASRRDVYDAQIRLLLAQRQVTSELLDTMERSRARSLSDKPFRVQLPEVQARLQRGETMVVFWVSGKDSAAVWLTNSAAGFANPRQLPPAKRLIIVPDGGIETTPIERGLDAEVMYLPAIRLLSTLSSAPSSQTGILLAGPGLSNTSREIADIERIFPAQWTKGRTRDAALAAMPAASFIHIAAHAIPDYDREERSRILLRDGPLLLSDVAKARLTSDLVTLSACQSGAGRQIRGEGPQSLASAFLAAGAHTVVAARQPVDDAAARAFMTQFYAALAAGETKAAALQTAKRRLRDSGGPLANPQYWEPWILYGDGRSPIASTRRWTWLLWFAAALAAIAAVATGLRPVAV
ncbi:MAG: CHAT domain-containing protein, partial [Acidobacteria bacterium]|nr:CHAT domain-containing protein [Acidobacteriota bacterium]